MKAIQRIVLGLAVAAVPATATAQNIDFEGIGPNRCTYTYDWIPNGYAGFNWTNMVYVNKCTFPGTGAQYGATSGNYVAANWIGAGSMWLASGTFSLHGNAWLTAGFADGQVGHVSGWNGSTMLFEAFVTLSLKTPTAVNLNGWAGLSRLVFDGGGVPMAIDDVDPDVDGGVGADGVTPEPATLLLLGSGLTGMGGFVRRRRNRPSTSA